MGVQEQVSYAGTRNTLCELAKYHGTDKYPWYTPFYGSLLHRKEIFKVLEIGVHEGASLRMWQEYFPWAKVYGMDILAKTHGLNVFIGDQGSRHELERVAGEVGPFDLIIDDGSHTPHDQVLGALTLRPHLKPGGLYIIEDVNPPVSAVVDNLPFPNQYVECRIPGSDKVGRCVVIQS